MTIIVIPLKVTSGNNLIRMHWSKRAKHDRLWKDVVAAVLPLWKRPAAPIPHALVLVHAVLPKILDDDNLRTGCKAMIDALRHIGLIAGDAPHQMLAIYEQTIGKPHSVHVSITTMPDTGKKEGSL